MSLIYSCASDVDERIRLPLATAVTRWVWLTPRWPARKLIAGCAAALLAVVATSAPVPAAREVAAGSWKPTAAIGIPRLSDHTATLLSDGKVLVAGGYKSFAHQEEPDRVTEAAEIYDPVAGEWAATGAMTLARAEHTATLLPDGKVLIAGGYPQSGDETDAAEIFDPGTGAWSATAPLAAGRIGHTATLLDDGRVLVAGGLTVVKDKGYTYAESAELFDPATRTWAPTGSMSLGRTEHTATLLGDGNVLVSGGQGAGVGPALRDSTVFDPGTGTWSVVPRLLETERSSHSATRLADGRILLIGGSTKQEHGGGGDPVQSSELFDPARQSWSVAPRLAQPRLAHTATMLPDGKILVVGGFARLISGRRVPPPVASAELYEPSTRRWSQTGRTVVPPSSSGYRELGNWLQGGNHTATLLSTRPCGGNCDKVLVVGGDGGSANSQLYSRPSASPNKAESEGELPAVAVALGLALLVLVVVLLARRRAVRPNRGRS